MAWVGTNAYFWIITLPPSSSELDPFAQWWDAARLFCLLIKLHVVRGSMKKLRFNGMVWLKPIIIDCWEIFTLSCWQGRNLFTRSLFLTKRSDSGLCRVVHEIFLKWTLNEAHQASAGCVWAWHICNKMSASPMRRILLCVTLCYLWLARVHSSIHYHSLFKTSSFSVEHTSIFFDQLRNLHVAYQHTPLLICIYLGAIQSCPLFHHSSGCTIISRPPLLLVLLHIWRLFSWQSNCPVRWSRRVVSHLHGLIIPWPQRRHYRVWLHCHCAFLFRNFDPALSRGNRYLWGVFTGWLLLRESLLLRVWFYRNGSFEIHRASR